MTLVRALRHPDFALVWLARLVSSLGDGVHAVALAWLVLEVTGSAAAMGLVLTARLIPTIALLALGGTIVDRLPRLAVMTGSDLLRAAVTAAIAGLTWSGLVAFEHLVLLGVAFGSVDAFFAPAYQALVAELLPAADRPSGNALSSMAGRMALVAGPAVGALLVAAGSTALAFGLDAASFVVSALLLWGAAAARRRAPVVRGTVPDAAPAIAPVIDPVTVATGAPVSEPAARRGLLEDVRVGLRTLVDLPWVGVTIAFAGVTNILLAGPLGSSMPLLVERQLGGDVAVLGMVGSATAAGAVTAAVLMGTRARLRRRWRLIYVPWLVLALATAAMGLPVVGVAGVVVAAAIVGACETTLGLAWTNAVQDHVPEDRLGRVYSLDALGSYAFIPVGYLVAGVASDAAGPGPVFVAGGLISAAAVGLVVLLPQVRALD